MVLSDYIGKCGAEEGCALSPNDMTPNSCSCHVCIDKPCSVKSEELWISRAVPVGLKDLFESSLNPFASPTVTAHVVGDATALYAPSFHLCSQMTGTEQYRKQQQFPVQPHYTYSPFFCTLDREPAANNISWILVTRCDRKGQAWVVLLKSNPLCRLNPCCYLPYGSKSACWFSVTSKTGFPWSLKNGLAYKKSTGTFGSIRYNPSYPALLKKGKHQSYQRRYPGVQMKLTNSTDIPMTLIKKEKCSKAITYIMSKHKCRTVLHVKRESRTYWARLSGTNI